MSQGVESERAEKEEKKNATNSNFMMPLASSHWSATICRSTREKKRSF